MWQQLKEKFAKADLTELVLFLLSCVLFMLTLVILLGFIGAGICELIK